MHETAASCIHFREFTQPQANPEYKSQFEYVNDAGWSPSGLDVMMYQGQLCLRFLSSSGYPWEEIHKNPSELI